MLIPYFRLRIENGSVLHPKAQSAIKALYEDLRCRGGTALDDFIHLS